MADNGFGIYIHWPFCQAKCPYCDFNSYVSKTIEQSEWCDAYLKEIDRYAREFPDHVVRSIFFGGGTPSLMDPSTVDAVISRIQNSWRWENNVEITLEANPSSVELNRFQDYRKAGVNRVSLGIQALNDEDLRRLGRLHSAVEAREAMEVAQNVFDRASFDLIYARQHQDIQAWEAELTAALSYGFSHMSLYQLTIEDGTAFGDRFAKGKLAGLPQDDHAADMYDLTVDICESHGLSRYEVSNFAQPGEESLHNLIYWNYGEYAGIGPGAHGRLISQDCARLATETSLSPKKWLFDVNAGTAESFREPLSHLDQLSEKLVMGLRLQSGVSISQLEMLGWTENHQLNLNALLDDQIVVVSDGKIIVEKQYVKLLNSILDRLLNY